MPKHQTFSTKEKEIPSPSIGTPQTKLALVMLDDSSRPLHPPVYQTVFQGQSSSPAQVALAQAPSVVIASSYPCP